MKKILSLANTDSHNSNSVNEFIHLCLQTALGFGYMAASVVIKGTMEQIRNIEGATNTLEEEADSKLSDTEVGAAKILAGVGIGFGSALALTNTQSALTILPVGLTLLPKNTMQQLAKSLFGKYDHLPFMMQHIVTSLSTLLNGHIPIDIFRLGMVKTYDMVESNLNADTQTFFKSCGLRQRLWLWSDAIHTGVIYRRQFTNAWEKTGMPADNLIYAGAPATLTVINPAGSRKIGHPSIFILSMLLLQSTPTQATDSWDTFAKTLEPAGPPRKLGNVTLPKLGLRLKLI